MENKNELLRQANVLTESRYDFNPIEKRCLYKIIQKVRRDYVEGERTIFDNLHVKIPAKDLDEVIDKKHRRLIKEALINLRHRDITMEKPDESWFNCGFINWTEHDAKTNIYDVEVCSKIMPFLVELAREYTEYSLTVAISLKSKWSQRFYELCCQYRNIGKFGKTIEQLRKMFTLEDKYPNLPDFKSFVINKAQKELKSAYEASQCDLWFEYVQEGRGASAHFEFFIHTKERDARQKEIWADLSKQIKYINTTLRLHFKKDPKYCDRVIKALNLDPDNIRPVFDKITKLEKDFKGAEFAKICRYILREDFNMQ